MLALPLSCTRPIAAARHGSVRCIPTILTPTLAHYFPPSLLPNTKRTRLLGSPRAAAPVPAPPQPENTEAAAFKDGEAARDAPAHQKSITVKLAAVFGLCCTQIVIFNIYSKKALNLFPCPWLIASFQLLVGSLWMIGLWTFRLHPYPRVNRKFFLALLCPAFFHAVGYISASISLSKASVSFTHVIRASEPVFSIVFSALHGSFHPIHVWLSLLPIAAGCAAAAITEVTFSAEGFYGALISNAGFALRNIYSEQSLHEFKHVDGLSLYGWISIVSLIYLSPVAVLVEGRHSWPVPAAGSSTLYTWVLISGAFYHLHNQTAHQLTALMDESTISPVTLSVGNAMKRLVVITASVIAFRSPVRALNALCSAIAIFGTFLYSQATAAGNGRRKIAREFID